MCAYFYDKHGVPALYSLLHCGVNIPLALICAIDGVPASSAWRVSLIEVPSLKDGVDIHFHEQEILVTLKYVSDIDRLNTLVGPIITVTNHCGMERRAAEDLVSYSYNEKEYVVLGCDDFYATQIDGSRFIPYKHVDSPSSKTNASHYRLYCTTGVSMIDGQVICLPVIYARIIRSKTSTNILDRLPYPRDLYKIMEERPDLVKTTLALIYHIINGFKLEISCNYDLYKITSQYSSLCEKDVFDNELYKRTEYSDRNHGIGWIWNDIYEKMFY